MQNGKFSFFAVCQIGTIEFCKILKYSIVYSQHLFRFLVRAKSIYHRNQLSKNGPHVKSTLPALPIKICSRGPWVLYCERTSRTLATGHLQQVVERQIQCQVHFQKMISMKNLAFKCKHKIRIVMLILKIHELSKGQ